MRETDPFADTAARLLKAARLQAGISLRALARRAGTSHATLIAYEAGRKCPSTATFFRILDACEYAVDIRLRPRIRWRDGIARGEELESVLALAEAFPVRAGRRMNYPVFPDPV